MLEYFGYFLPSVILTDVKGYSASLSAMATDDRGARRWRAADLPGADEAV